MTVQQEEEEKQEEHDVEGGQPKEFSAVTTATTTTEDHTATTTTTGPVHNDDEADVITPAKDNNKDEPAVQDGQHCSSNDDGEGNCSSDDDDKKNNKKQRMKVAADAPWIQRIWEVFVSADCFVCFWNFVGTKLLHLVLLLPRCSDTHTFIIIIFSHRIVFLDNILALGFCCLWRSTGSCRYSTRSFGGATRLARRRAIYRTLCHWPRIARSDIDTARCCSGAGTGRSTGRPARLFSMEFTRHDHFDHVWCLD